MRDEHYARETRWPDSAFWRRRQPRITLNPQAQLAASPGTEHLLERLPMHLCGADLRRLRALCEPTRAAHEVVTRFRQVSPRISERRVVLALQCLLNEGVLSRTEASSG